MQWITVAALMGLPGLVGQGNTARPLTGEEQQHATSLKATITLRGGGERTVVVEGVGCSSSMCSRVSLNGSAPDGTALGRTWLDSIAAIRDVSPVGGLFVFKNGTQQRLSVAPLNRVLYLKDQKGRTEKLDLNRIQSVEFGL
jgi:hypothetical protein